MRELKQLELFPPDTQSKIENASRAERAQQGACDAASIARRVRAPSTQVELWGEQEKKYTLKPSFWNEGVYYIQDKQGFSPDNGGAVYKPWWSGLPCQEMWWFDLLACGCDINDLWKPWLVEDYPLKH